MFGQLHECDSHCEQYIMKIHLQIDKQSQSFLDSIFIFVISFLSNYQNQKTKFQNEKMQIFKISKRLKWEQFLLFNIPNVHLLHSKETVYFFFVKNTLLVMNMSVFSTRMWLSDIFVCCVLFISQLLLLLLLLLSLKVYVLTKMYEIAFTRHAIQSVVESLKKAKREWDNHLMYSNWYRRPIVCITYALLIYFSFINIVLVIVYSHKANGQRL